MPARIDLDAREMPAQIIHRIYNADFVTGIGQQFQFAGKDPEIVAQIIRMGISYIALRRMENRGDMQRLHNHYIRFARDIKSFQQVLEKSAQLDLSQLMYFSALELNQPPPGGNFPGLTKHQRERSGDPYILELRRLLEILAKGAEEHARRSAPNRGPPVNWGLQTLALHAAQFFSIELKGRPFTIDPHKPFKPTVAFDFIRALVQPLDTVTDNQIVSAIRAAKAPRRKRKG
jgi:hypothetical protein